MLVLVTEAFAASLTDGSCSEDRQGQGTTAGH